jgi:dCTP deaminase
MAFWGRNRWLDEGEKGYRKCPVLPWNIDRVEAAGYRLSIGNEYFINGSGSSTVVKLSKGQGFVIEPGQFAFILTGEKVNISKAAIGFISIRASTKFRGLINVSGFQVNPGFNGNLVFAVFNAGPRHINLREGDEIFSLWIADLDAPVAEDLEESGNIPNGLDRIRSDEINKIAGNSLTAYQLSDRLEKVEKNLVKFKTIVVRTSLILSTVLALLLVAYREPLSQFLSGDGGTQQESSISVPLSD